MSVAGSVYARARASGLMGATVGAGSMRQRAGGERLLFEELWGGSIDGAKWSTGGNPAIQSGKLVILDGDQSIVGNCQTVPTFPANHRIEFDIEFDSSNGGQTAINMWLRSHETEAGLIVQYNGAGVITNLSWQFNRTGGAVTIGSSNASDWTQLGDYSARATMSIKMVGSLYTFKIGNTEVTGVDSGFTGAADVWAYFVQGDAKICKIDNIRIYSV